MSDYTSWHVGMRLVCINDDFTGCCDQTYPDRPVQGRVYTADGVWFDEITGDEPMVSLCEFAGRHVLPSGRVLRYGFWALRFRPVQTRKTDISIFERIRDNPKAPIIEQAPKERVS